MPARLVTGLSAIDFGRGREALYRDQLPGLLTELASRARVLSITASSAIEGVVVDDAVRAERIINRQVGSLRNRSEQELAGYRDAQDYLFREDWRSRTGSACTSSATLRRRFGWLTSESLFQGSVIRRFGWSWSS